MKGVRKWTKIGGVFLSAGTLVRSLPRRPVLPPSAVGWAAWVAVLLRSLHRPVAGHWANEARTVVVAALAGAALGKDVLRSLAHHSLFTRWGRSELCAACGLGR